MSLTPSGTAHQLAPQSDMLFSPAEGVVVKQTVASGANSPHNSGREGPATRRPRAAEL